MVRRSRLILEDGTVYDGIGFGAGKESGGEIVFNTSMTGYQEILTDPSYKGEIVVMTYPTIGNYGINFDDEQSGTAQVNGFVVRELCNNPENWRSRLELEAYLHKNDIVGIAGVDTRALTKKLRKNGTMRGLISSEGSGTAQLSLKARKLPALSEQDLVREVTTQKPYQTGKAEGMRIVLIDCGAKKNIVKSLVRRKCQVIVVPAFTDAGAIMSYQPDGIMISNGPGDPGAVPYVVETVKELLGQRPIFGICLGHQILGLACGAATYKLKFGHRGANHPVRDLRSGRVYITSQNHGYAIREDSLAGLELEVTHLNVNDRTVEGLRHKKYPAFSVQYHPEAAPGPRDSHYLFDHFISLIA